MGCAPRVTKYRKTHTEAWRYLLEELKPDIALVQEVLFKADPIARQHGELFWSVDKGSESGTAVFVRHGIAAHNVVVRSAGSYLAGAELTADMSPMLIVSIHVGPPNYRKHLRAVADALAATVVGRRFLIGGDLNAARRLDKVYGGTWFTQFFEDLSARGFHDCHWDLHRMEVQSFWGHQAKEAYQCDHLFVDHQTRGSVHECQIIDNLTVRALSDHSPIRVQSDDDSGRAGEYAG